MKSEGDTIGGNTNFKQECWDEVEFVWNKKPFLRTSVPEIFRVPIVDNIDGVNSSLLKKIAKLEVQEEPEKMLMLRHPISSWKEEVLISISKPIEDPDCVLLTGSFRSKVFQGNATQLRSFFKQMDSYLSSQNERATTYYAFKTNCKMISNIYEECTYVIIAQVVNTKNGMAESFDIDVTLPNSHPSGDNDYNGN